MSPQDRTDSRTPRRLPLTAEQKRVMDFCLADWNRRMEAWAKEESDARRSS